MPARKMGSDFQAEETVCANEQGMRGLECPGISGKLSRVYAEDVRTERSERSLERKGSGGSDVLGNWLSNKWANKQRTRSVEFADYCGVSIPIWFQVVYDLTTASQNS